MTQNQLDVCWCGSSMRYYTIIYISSVKCSIKWDIYCEYDMYISTKGWIGWFGMNYYAIKFRPIKSNSLNYINKHKNYNTKPMLWLVWISKFANIISSKREVKLYILKSLAWKLCHVNILIEFTRKLKQHQYFSPLNIIKYECVGRSKGVYHLK